MKVTEDGLTLTQTQTLTLTLNGGYEDGAHHQSHGGWCRQQVLLQFGRPGRREKDAC